MIFVGALRHNMTRLAALLGAIVFFAFAFGRTVGMALDGWPGESILAALAIELVIGLLCLFALRAKGRMPSPLSQPAL